MADAKEPLFSRDIAGHSVVHHWNRMSTYRLSRLCGQGVTTPWPETTDICCWHCTEPFPNQPVGIPTSLENDGTVLCQGNFCSYACALAHTFADGASHREYRTKQLLTMVAREMHGEDDVRPAPPRLVLQKFGGPLSIEAFRSTRNVHSVVVNPPFVSQDMVYEESGANAVDVSEQRPPRPEEDAPHGDGEMHVETGGWCVAGLRVPAESLAPSSVLSESEPLCDGMYDDFLADADGTAEADADADETVEQELQSFGGGLRRFINRGEDSADRSQTDAARLGE